MGIDLVHVLYGWSISIFTLKIFFFSRSLWYSVPFPPNTATRHGTLCRAVGEAHRCARSLATPRQDVEGIFEAPFIHIRVFIQPVLQQTLHSRVDRIHLLLRVLRDLVLCKSVNNRAFVNNRGVGCAFCGA